MAKANADMWDCVICGLERHVHGQPCPTWQTTCKNRERAHITGRWYLKKPLDWHPLNMRELAAISIGIGAISDEDKGSKHDET